MTVATCWFCRRLREIQPGCRQASSVYTPWQADGEQHHSYAAPLSCGWNGCLWSWISSKNISGISLSNTYIVFGDGRKLASSNRKTAPTLKNRQTKGEKNKTQSANNWKHLDLPSK